MEAYGDEGSEGDCNDGQGEGIVGGQGAVLYTAPPVLSDSGGLIWTPDTSHIVTWEVHWTPPDSI